MCQAVKPSGAISSNETLTCHHMSGCTVLRRVYYAGKGGSAECLL